MEDLPFKPNTYVHYDHFLARLKQVSGQPGKRPRFPARRYPRRFFDIDFDSLIGIVIFNGSEAMALSKMPPSWIGQRAGSDELIQAAENVLNALDNLAGLGIEDRRSRSSQDQKLIVQEAFRVLYGSYSKNSIVPVKQSDQAHRNH